MSPMGSRSIRPDGFVSKIAIYSRLDKCFYLLSKISIVEGRGHSPSAAVQLCQTFSGDGSRRLLQSFSPPEIITFKKLLTNRSAVETIYVSG